MRLLVRTPIKEPIHALNGVTFDLFRGEILAVVGPNGAGKSTLFRLLVGLTTPTSGLGLVFGHDISRSESTTRRLIGFTSADDRTLFLRQTVQDNLVFHGRLHGMTDDEMDVRITEVLKQVGLEAARERSGFAMSAGMRARLQIARGLLHSPRLLVLDEPTGAVDPIAAFGLIELIRDIAQREGVAVLISSHRLDEIESLGKNVLLLDKGHVRFHGDLERLRAQYDTNVAEISFVSPSAARSAYTAASNGSKEHVSVTLKNEVVEVGPQEAVGEVILSMGSEARGISRIEEPQRSLMELLARMYQSDDREGGGVDQT
jgi:ABC-2 type transport system ATP-binding protein